MTMRTHNCPEENQVYGIADRLCAEAGRYRDGGSGSLLQAGHQQIHLLQLEEEVQRPERRSLKRAAAVERRERAVEADRGGPDARQQML